MNPAKWNLACTPKELGGLGLMDLSTFNQALLLKWYWQWGKPQITLCKSVFRNNIGLKGLPESPIFNTALKGTTKFCNFAFAYHPGNGENIRFWDNRWDGITVASQFPNLYTFALDPNISLQQMTCISPLQSHFRAGLSDIAQEELVRLRRLLTGIQLNPLTIDEIFWPWNSTGIYTVREGYRVMKNIPRIRTNAHKVWKLPAPPRMKVFGWMMLLNKLLTIDNLNKRGWPLVNRCVLCKGQNESVYHIFHACTFSREVYRQLVNEIPDKMPLLAAAGSSELITNTSIPKQQRGLLLIAQFCIWRERCNRTFTEENKEPKEIKNEVLWQSQFFADRTTRNSE